MTNQPQSVETLFEAALSLPPEQRCGFLDRACLGAPMLRRLVEQLLEEDGLPGSFLRTPALRAQISQSSTPSSPAPLSVEGLPRFGAGEMIAGRFLVVRFIARGGMGEVYEVQDRFLQGSPIALKIIRPQIATDPYSASRFQQEVLLARKVHHRNLCPIYDIFHCEDTAPPFLFLTMKLLAGESLEARLKRDERIPLEEAEQVCGQLIDGIKAIHDAGIIHRDIKPNNVMLEPWSDGICATIMDFGLARLSEADATLSRAGQVAGTPGYLAPELIRGASPSPASDLYALGVVLHQVLTGERPLASKSGGAAAVSPKLHQSKAPAGLVHAVAEFLSEDPERRCRAFLQVIHAETYSDAPKPFLLTRRSFVIGSTATLGLVGAGSIWKWREIYNLLHPLPAKRFVALLNWPPPSDAKVTPMVLGLIDTMVNALSRAEAFDRNFYVACQTSLAEMKTPAQVNDVCELLGANLFLATSVSINTNGILLILSVTSKESLKVLRSRTFEVPPAQQFAMSVLATRAAAELLDIPPLSVDVLPTLLDTKSSQALAAFQAGEALLKEPNYGGVDAAIEQLKLAVDTDPRFANAHARLAIAYYQRHAVHHDAASLLLARANADKALALDPNSVEGHSALAAVYEETGNLPEAIDEIAKALAPDPNNSRIAVYQAQTYFAARRWQDAEDCFKRILKARPNYWYAYNELANNYSYQGKYKLALKAYQAASISGPRNVMPIAGTALMFFLLGDLDSADAAVLKSLSLAPLSFAFQIRADTMLVRNKLSQALRAALQATKVDPQDGTAWLKLADVCARMKNDKTALASYKRALASTDEALDVDPNDGSTWILMALLRCKLGDQAAAESSLKKAEEKNAIDIYSLVQKIRILELLGRRDEALSFLETCLKMGATTTQIKSTSDLEALSLDPRYFSLTHSATSYQP